MERLTREMTFEEEYTLLQKEAKELFDKEDGKSEPPRSHNIVRRALRCIKKLLAEVEPYKTYEDLEEQGLLIRLPCKPSDVTVYQLRNKKHALGVGISPRRIYCTSVWANGDYALHHQGTDDCLKRDFNKTWFLTKEEAERALEARNDSRRSNNNT